MKALTDRWDVFKTALGSRRYIVADVVKIALAIVTVLYLYWYGHNMSYVEIGLTVATVLFGLFFWVTLEYGLTLTRQISDARLRLAELRHEGVRLRNHAPTNEESFPNWQKKVLAWKEDVESELGKISKSDAVWFSILDVVPPPRLDPPQWPATGTEYAAFQKLFKEHDCRLDRLGDMIRELWSKR